MTAESIAVPLGDQTDVASRTLRAGRALGLLVVILCPIAAAFVVYQPYINDFFATDDFHWLNAAQNPNAFQFLRRAVEFPKPTSFEFATPGWRPLIDVYFYLAYRVFGLSSTGYHLVNIALHAGIAAMFGVLLWRTTRNAFLSWGAALVFVVAPSYDLVVPSISHATELWSSFFFVLTLVLYASALGDGRVRSLPLAVAFVSFALALAGRQAAVELPLVLAGEGFLLVRPASRKEWRLLLGSVLPFAGVALVYVIFSYFNEYHHAEADNFVAIDSHTPAKYWDYLKWTLLPLPSSLYPWVAEAQKVCAIAFLVSAPVWLLLRKWTALWLSVWALAALAPFAVINRPELEPRYTYMASAPIAAMAVLLIDSVRRIAGGRPNSVLLTATASAGIVVLAVFMGHRAREQQWWITLQSRNFESVLGAMRSLCGPMPPQSHFYLINSPAFDPVAINSVSMANVWYRDVYLDFGAPPPGGRAGAETCALSYDSGTWTRVN